MRPFALALLLLFTALPAAAQQEALPLDQGRGWAAVHLAILPASLKLGGSFVVRAIPWVDVEMLVLPLHSEMLHPEIIRAGPAFKLGDERDEWGLGKVVHAGPRIGVMATHFMTSSALGKPTYFRDFYLGGVFELTYWFHQHLGLSARVVAGLASFRMPLVEVQVGPAF
jgi:hypothetical protein